MASTSRRASCIFAGTGCRADPAKILYRVYKDDCLGRLSFIRAGQTIGLTLGELREIVEFRDRGETPCSHVVTLLDRKVAEIGQRIAELQELQQTLRGLQERAAHLSPEECPPTLVCHVILPKMPTEQATQAKAEPARRRV